MKLSFLIPERLTLEPIKEDVIFHEIKEISYTSYEVQAKSVSGVIIGLRAEKDTSEHGEKLEASLNTFTERKGYFMDTFLVNLENSKNEANTGTVELYVESGPSDSIYAEILVPIGYQLFAVREEFLNRKLEANMHLQRVVVKNTHRVLLFLSVMPLLKIRIVICMTWWVILYYCHQLHILKEKSTLRISKKNLPLGFFLQRTKKNINLKRSFILRLKMGKSFWSS